MKNAYIWYVKSKQKQILYLKRKLESFLSLSLFIAKRK